MRISAGVDIDVTITLRNPTRRELPVTIPMGAVFEAAKTSFGVQNVTIIKAEHFMLPPRSELKVTITGRCLNRSRSIPSGVPGRLTPFRYAGSNFDQQYLWQRMVHPISH
jgi:hypothetical protein